MPPQFFLFPMIFLALPVGAAGFFGYLALRFVRMKEREAAVRVRSTAADAEELARMQETLTALQSEVDRLREHQTFLERLLEKPQAERTPN